MKWGLRWGKCLQCDKVKLRVLPKIWDGRASTVEMRDAGFPHWRQMEWIGFYFQFLCEKHLSGTADIPGPK